MHPLKNGPIAIYARFSSSRQSETSIEDQVRRCRDYIAQAGRDAKTAQVFTDFAISGSSLDRPGFEALMLAVKQHQIGAIVTEDLSRISRDFADAAVIFKALQFARVPLIGVADGIDTSAKDAKLSYTLKSLVADLYLDDLRDKTLRGLEGKALAGYATGNTPYGYRTIAEVDGAGRKLGHRIEIDEDQASIVRRIFSESLRGRSLTAIARGLNEDGIPSPRAQRKTRHKRKGWGSSTIRAMLYNDKYAGVWKYKARQWVKVPGENRRIPRDRDASDVMCFERPELRIIDADLWDAVQRRLAAMKRKYTRHHKKADKGAGADTPNPAQVIAGNKSKYLLSGVMVCGLCGAPMTIHGGGKAKYYRCATNRHKGLCENRRSIREDVLRPGILAAIRERLMSDDGIAYVRKRLARELGDLSRRLEDDLRDHKARLARTEEKIDSLISFIARGESSDYIATALRDLETRARADKAEIARLVDAIKTPIKLPTVSDVTAMVFDLEARLTQDPEVGRQTLQQWFRDERIEVIPQDDGSVMLRGALLPLVVLDAARPRNKTRKVDNRAAQEDGPVWSNLCSGGEI